MNALLSKYRLLSGVCLSLAVVMLAGCDSDSGAVIKAGQTDTVIDGATDGNYVDFDLDAMDAQVIESREPGPSLGFALPPNGRFFAQTGAVGSIRGSEFT